MTDTSVLIPQYFALENTIQQTELSLADSERFMASEFICHACTKETYNSLACKLTRLNNRIFTSGNEYQQLCNVSSRSDQAKQKMIEHEKLTEEYRTLKNTADIMLAHINAHGTRVDQCLAEQDELKTKLFALKSCCDEIQTVVNHLLSLS
jgi:hypothetical protein